MVTFHVIGHRGLLGSTVERRWREHGATCAPIATADHIVNATAPDNWVLIQSLPLERVIQPSSDAIAEATPYGATKREVEALVRPRGLVLRTGLVDPRRVHPVAFVNWISNPLTPLEWADLAWDVRDQRGLVAEGREAVNRYQIGCLLAASFNLHEPAADVSITAQVRLVQGSRSWPPLAEAIRAWRAWLG